MEVDESTDQNSGSKPAESDKKEDDIIVLDDDEPADVIDLVGKEKPVGNRKCINYECSNGQELNTPPEFVLSFYRVRNSSSAAQKVCKECYDIAIHHYDKLYDAMVNDENIMEVDFPVRDETYALDSDSDDEEDNKKNEEVTIDEETMRMLQENFDEVLGSAMSKVNYEEKVDDAIKSLNKKYENNHDSYLEVKTMLDSIRKEVDTMLFDLYDKLRPNNKILPELSIGDEDNSKLSSDDKDVRVIENVSIKSQIEFQTPDIPLDCDPPPNLPPKGKLLKPSLRLGSFYYVKRNSEVLSWVKIKLDNILMPGNTLNGQEVKQTIYQVIYENKQKVSTKRYVTGKEIAYSKPMDVLVEVGARVIALFKEFGDLKISRRDAFYPGVIGESPSKANRYRYLVFFDDGYAHYVEFNNVFPIYESSKNVWEDVGLAAMPFIKKYVSEYPNRSMVKLLKNQTVRTEFRGKWYVTTVLNVDCSLVQIFFDVLNRVEWIYRGSRRLNTIYKEEQAATNRLQHKQRTPRAVTTTNQGKVPYVQYTRDDPDVVIVPQDVKPGTEPNESRAPQRSVAKKSTRVSMPPPNEQINTRPFLPVEKNEGPPGKIVYYTPRKQNSAQKIFRPHLCSEECQKDMHTPLARLKGYGPLAKPLLVGFHRLQYKIKGKKSFIVYKTPCGRTVRNMEELHQYLRMTRSQLSVDLFNFDFWVRCLAEFILEPNNPIIKDLSNGLEDIQIPVVNYVDSDPCKFMDYSTRRMPTNGVHLNLDPEFLVGCDCEDDCLDKKKCKCWKLTFQGLKYLNKDENEVGYKYRRLQEPIFTGIYECNSRCKCAKTCLNRVVQHPMQHKLQVFKTVNRGWGIRCINDIPQGSFVCVYAGLLLTDETANTGGKTDGDEYLAELDYIEAVESFKEDYEEEAYMSEEDTKKSVDDDEEDEEEEDDEDEIRRGIIKGKNIMHDYDFIPTATTSKLTDEATNIRTRLRKRTSYEQDDKKFVKKHAAKKTIEDETVTISDDEDIREPSSFNPAEDDLDKNLRKYRSVRNMFGENESSYIMDAKYTGNIGRYLNHSCSPNIFVQNVFVDTHDLRFPWVSFFAKTYVRAGTELTWNYNYDIGSVDGKFLICRCGSSECKGRLL